MQHVPPPPDHDHDDTAPSGASGAGGGSGTGWAPAREHAPGAVGSLVFGILGMTFLPVIGSIVALVLGYQSRNATRAQPDRYDDQMGQVGRILGWIGLILTVAVLLLALLAFLLFFVFLGGMPPMESWGPPR